MHFSDKAIPKPYEKVKAVLKNAEFVALTTDGWTSRSMEGYITVTAHFIHEWETKNYVLQTKNGSVTYIGKLIRSTDFSYI